MDNRAQKASFKADFRLELNGTEPQTATVIDRYLLILRGEDAG